jgi:hypothetical protein
MEGGNALPEELQRCLGEMISHESTQADPLNNYRQSTLILLGCLSAQTGAFTVSGGCP